MHLQGIYGQCTEYQRTIRHGVKMRESRELMCKTVSTYDAWTTGTMYSVFYYPMIFLPVPLGPHVGNREIPSRINLS